MIFQLLWRHPYAITRQQRSNQTLLSWATWSDLRWSRILWEEGPSTRSLAEPVPGMGKDPDSIPSMKDSHVAGDPHETLERNCQLA